MSSQVLQAEVESARWKFGLHIEMKAMEMGNMWINRKDIFPLKKCIKKLNTVVSPCLWEICFNTPAVGAWIEG